MITIVTQQDATVRNIADSYNAKNYITKDISPNFSLAINEGINHEETETTDYDRIYYVLEGGLSIKVDNEVYVVNAGDACFIPAGTTYDFYGSFKSVVVNQPAFGSKSR